MAASFFQFGNGVLTFSFILLSEREKSATKEAMAIFSKVLSFSSQFFDLVFLL